VALYACAFSYGENTLGAAWTTVSEDTGVSLTNMNGGSALNYLLLVRHPPLSKSNQSTDNTVGLREHLLDSSRNEDRPSASFPHHHHPLFVRWRLARRVSGNGTVVRRNDLEWSRDERILGSNSVECLRHVIRS
jgi:hypothetical protein